MSRNARSGMSCHPITILSVSMESFTRLAIRLVFASSHTLRMGLEELQN